MNSALFASKVSVIFVSSGSATTAFMGSICTNSMVRVSSRHALRSSTIVVGTTIEDASASEICRAHFVFAPQR